MKGTAHDRRATAHQKENSGGPIGPPPQYCPSCKAAKGKTAKKSDHAPTGAVRSASQPTVS